jgi:hypothetical protein
VGLTLFLAPLSHRLPHGCDTAESFLIILGHLG